MIFEGSLISNPCGVNAVLHHAGSVQNLSQVHKGLLHCDSFMVVSVGAQVICPSGILFHENTKKWDLQGFASIHTIASSLVMETLIGLVG